MQNDPTFWVSLLTFLAVVISALTLGVSITQGRRRQREYLDTRLNTMATDIAKIFGWLEGQRDQRISKTAPDLPQ